MNDVQKGRRIGIMGGSFNPIHYGHLMLAEQIRAEYEMDYIIFVPVGKAPHKEMATKDNREERLMMTELATKSNPHFRVCDFEVKRDVVSYSIDTILYLKETLNPEDELYFITGADAIILLDTWHKSEELCKYVSFVGATRPGIDHADFKARIDALTIKYNAKIETCLIPALAISSTDIRSRVRAGRTIKYFLPENVEHYIYEKGLYLE